MLKKCIDPNITIKNIKDRKLTLHKAVRQGLVGHQDFNRCKGKTGCGIKKCACNAAEMLCNSKSHANQIVQMNNL
jgi:hypothetical protein